MKPQHVALCSPATFGAPKCCSLVGTTDLHIRFRAVCGSADGAGARYNPQVRTYLRLMQSEQKRNAHP
jgi:hypothetical protein